MSPEVRAFWAAYRATHPEVPDEEPDVFAFGDSPEMAEELGLLVLHGPKRATAGLLRDFEGAALPRPAGHAIVLGGDGRPLAVIRTTEVRVGPLAWVDEAFAWDEGEGERTRDDWLDGHRRYFARQAEREGWAFDVSVATVFERFDLVWPLNGARRGL